MNFKWRASPSLKLNEKKILSPFPEIDGRIHSKTIFLSHKNTKPDVNISSQALPFEQKEDGRLGFIPEEVLGLKISEDLSN